MDHKVDVPAAGARAGRGRRVLVCGGRSLADGPEVRAALAALIEPTDVVITGGAPGADAIAHEFAKALGCGTAVYSADWRRLGPAAGPLRNQQMLDEGKPDIVLALPGGSGTADMVRRARERGIECVSPL